MYEELHELRIKDGMNHLKKNSSKASRNLRCKASIGFILARCQARWQLPGGGWEPGVPGAGGCGALPGPGCPYDWTPAAARRSGEMG